MAVLPSGAHYVNSSRKSEGITLASGTHVKRATGENMGAKELGFKSSYDYRKNKDVESAKIDRILAGKQGSRDLARARANAKREGRRFDTREYKKVLIGLHKAERINGKLIDKSSNGPLGRFHRMMGYKDSEKWNY
jgi:hypothetical protein